MTWLAPDGSEMTEEQWLDDNARCMGMLMDGRAQPTGIRRSGADATLLLLVNAHHEPVNFQLPEVAQGSGWACLLDSNRPDLRTLEEHAFGAEFAVTSRSLLLFELQAANP
ncbi:hypothetical protein D3C81_1980700 [compost metagenome]